MAVEMASTMKFNACFNMLDDHKPRVCMYGHQLYFDVVLNTEPHHISSPRACARVSASRAHLSLSLSVLNVFVRLPLQKRMNYHHDLVHVC
jgi:hypothetical protein